MGSQVKGQPRSKRARTGAEVKAGQSATPEAREVLNSLRHIVRSLRVSSRDAEQRVGLSGAQLFVLQCLSRQSPCSVNELAASTATDQSSVSVVVSRLVSRGYVKRVTSKLDRRSVELSLTPAGRTLLLAAPEAAQERLLFALSQLKKSEILLLSSLLGKVVELAEVSQGNPTLFFEEGPTLVRPKGRGGDVRR
ncbi:MAG: MarR family winged helix-turn-helix transcriptional regulator [Myxococcales bacterium]